ncbi:MAG: hypothetical protein LBG80_02135 [Bacteroidales bacterium]|jgi:hypothetical protein|nr:hypothetical protein [Bacteroidales bacterium]
MKKKKAGEIVSLNEKIHSEFEIQKLELRLETDPLLFMDLFQAELFNTNDDTCAVVDALMTCSGETATLGYCPNYMS